MLGIEWRLSMGTCIWLLECLYTAVPPTPTARKALRISHVACAGVRLGDFYRPPYTRQPSGKEYMYS